MKSETLDRHFDTALAKAFPGSTVSSTPGKVSGQFSTKTVVLHQKLEPTAVWAGVQKVIRGVTAEPIRHEGREPLKGDTRLEVIAVVGKEAEYCRVSIRTLLEDERGFTVTTIDPPPIVRSESQQFRIFDAERRTG